MRTQLFVLLQNTLSIAYCAYSLQTTRPLNKFLSFLSSQSLLVHLQLVDIAMDFEELFKRDKRVVLYPWHKGIGQHNNVDSYHLVSSYKGLHDLVQSTRIPVRKLRFREVKRYVPGHIVVDGGRVKIKTQVSLPMDLNCIRPDTPF